MAIGDNYITTSDVKLWMGIQNTDYDTIIDAVVTSISRDIEDHCGRQFNDAGAVSARVYEPFERHACIVDDFWTTDGLIVQTDDDGDGVFETTWDPTDYELRPLNGVRYGRPGFPYWNIRVRRNSSRRFVWTENASVQVTAQWGWQSVPDQVVQAAKLLAADTFQLKDNRLGIAGSDQFGTVIRIKDNSIARGKLCKYVRGSVRLG